MFFDRKEDVIDLELTQYGKYLLSKGKMRPVYYAFYDDDILYDLEYAGKYEEQSNTEDRIRLETPRTRTQYVYSGIETEVKRINELVRSTLSAERVDLGDESIQPTNDKHFALISPIGTSDLNEQNAPSWYVKFHKGEMTEAKHYLYITGASSKTNMDRVINFPQIECQAVYNTSVNMELFDEADFKTGMLEVAELDLGIPSEVAGTDGFIRIDEDFLLIHIEEKNTEYLLKNFDIELFEIEEKKDIVNNLTVKTGEENLIPLNFMINQGYETRDKLNYNISTGGLYDEVDLNLAAPPATNKDVEYYFDLYIDEEIPEEVLCRHITDRSRGIFGDEFIDCEDLDDTMRIVEDIYDDEVSDGSGEIC